MKPIYNWFNRNLGLKLISVLISCLIWGFVSNYNDPQVTRGIRNVPVTFKNQEVLTGANKAYTVTDGIEKVNIYVTSRKSITNKLNSNSFTVKADMLNYNEALGTIPLEVSCSDGHVGQEDIRITPSSRRITMEDKVEESFGIATIISGKAAKGYEVGGTDIVIGDNVKIAGPTSLIRIIGKVMINVDITDMSADSEDAYPIRIEDKNGDTFTESQMKRLEIKDTDGIVLNNNQANVLVKIWKVYADIPVQLNIVGNPADNYRISRISLTPKSVNLVGQEEAIEALGGTLVLKDYISVEQMKQSQEYTLDLNDTLMEYDNIRLEEGTTSAINAKIDIAEIGSRTIQLPISMITMRNVPKDKKLIFSPADFIPVNIKTTEANLDDLHMDNVKADIDLKNCNINGSYTVPVVIEVPEKYEVVGDVTIVVNIEDIDNELEVEADAEEG